MSCYSMSCGFRGHRFTVLFPRRSWTTDLPQSPVVPSEAAAQILDSWDIAQLGYGFFIDVAPIQLVECPLG